MTSRENTLTTTCSFLKFNSYIKIITMLYATLKEKCKFNKKYNETVV